ncbi:MAG: hypothetical protein HY666_02825 [Chloroflexi bacterium]|nr:hypothetical protein [Chloroflexota bacterium]
MTSQQKPPVGQWNMPHRAVVFIHGVGEQERGDTLMDFVSPLIMWMEKRLSPKFQTKFGTNTPRLDSYPRLGGERAYVRMTLGDHRFELTEALWSTSFRPLPNDMLIKWVIRFFFFMWFANWRNFVSSIVLNPYQPKKLSDPKIPLWHPLIKIRGLYT